MCGYECLLAELISLTAAGLPKVTPEYLLEFKPEILRATSRQDLLHPGPIGWSEELTAARKSCRTTSDILEYGS